MSEQPITTKPSLFKIIALVELGEFMHPETLAKLSKCSKTAHTLVSATLLRKMCDKEEMRLMIPRLFPGIRGLPNDKELGYYHTLLNAYFTPPKPYEGIWSSIEVIFWVGTTLDRTVSGCLDMTVAIMPAMRSASGRKTILAAIKDWQAAMMSKPDTYVWKRCNLHKLHALAASVPTDFAVINNKITSQYDPRYF